MPAWPVTARSTANGGPRAFDRHVAGKLFELVVGGSIGIAFCIGLVIIWVGISQNARLLFIFLITLWPVLLNTIAGIRNVSRGYVEVGSAFGLSEAQLLWKITLPAAMPYILAGVRVSAGLAIIGMIVSEMEVSLTGQLLAVIFISSMFGVANVLVVKWVQATFFPWILESAAQQR